MRRNSPAKPRQSKVKGAKSEHSLHWHVAGLLDKHLAPPAWWTTFPAGGGGEMRGKILHSLGLKSGVPDILIFVPLTMMQAIEDQSSIEWITEPFGLKIPARLIRITVPLVYGIELKKTDRGQPSDTQIKTQAILTGMGCRVANCDSLESVKAALQEWAIPFRAKSQRQEIMQNALEKGFANV